MVLDFTVNNGFGGGGGEMTALPFHLLREALFRFCFPSSPPRRLQSEGHWCPPSPSLPALVPSTGWHVSWRATTCCTEWTRTQHVSWKLHLFSQLFNSGLPNWQPLDLGPGLLCIRRFSSASLSQCLHFEQLSAQSRSAMGR